MLETSFIHLPGIGLSTEQKLWERGVRTWRELEEFAPSFFQGERLDGVKLGLFESHQAWERRDPYFFYEELPRTELWRLVPAFREEIAFLDIETNGLKLPPVSQSTTITFYFRGELYQEHDPRLKQLLVRKMDDEAKVFCSFFGEVFDVPFLRKEFAVPLEKAHLDLCFWLKRLGFGGGLKKVEREFEDIRRRESLDIDGFDAVRLWKLHQKGTPGALETLLTYNAEDTLVLEALLVKAFNLELARRPHMQIAPMEFREPAALKTQIDTKVYESLREKSFDNEVNRFSTTLYA